MRFYSALGLILAAGLLTACASRFSCPEQHARHFIYSADDTFSANFQTNKQESARLMTPLFARLYAQGQQDKAQGLDDEAARQRVDALASDEAIAAIEHYSLFAGKAYQTTHGAKWRQRLKEEAVDAYWDGYMGRQ